MTAGLVTVRSISIASEARARRLSAALCLAFMLGLIVGLQHWTHGFEVWTFDGRRQLQMQAGELHAPSVALRSSEGRPLALWGEAHPAPAAYLVDFIYTRCPSVCRALGSDYQQMQRELVRRQGAEPALSGVHLLSISFDVENDHPAQLARHAAELGAGARHWTLAVPATPEDARHLLRSLGVVVIPDGEGGFVHNGAIHLLDERGRLSGLFDLDQWPQALEAAQRLAAARHGALR